MSLLLPQGHLIQPLLVGFFKKREGKLDQGSLLLYLEGLCLARTCKIRVVLTWPVFLGKRNFELL